MIDIVFKTDGDKIALSLERSGYTNGLTIVILNSDGTLNGVFRESSNIKAKSNITGMILDTNNFLTIALDVSLDGTD